MKRYNWIAFTVGCLTLLLMLGTAIARQGEARYLFVIPFTLTILGLVVVFLIVTSVLNKQKERWTALLLVAILLLGFSILTIFSVGLITAPLALFLLGLSIWKLVHQRIGRETR